LSFNVFLYGGIYTLNDLAECDSDRRHPLKRNRPIPSKAVSIRGAMVFGVIMIALGLLSSFMFFGTTFFCVFLIFMALNGLYSVEARGVPYLELVVNSSTHPVRYLMGVVLTGAKPPVQHLLAVFLVAFGFVCLRRLVEMDVDGWEARRTLMHYSRRGLLILQFFAFTGLLALFASDALMSKALFLTAIPIYVLLVFGTQISSNARELLQTIWLR
jgi:4-hydroxybenzoate polyprenyltransferase